MSKNDDAISELVFLGVQESNYMNGLLDGIRIADANYDQAIKNCIAALSDPDDANSDPDEDNYGSDEDDSPFPDDDPI